MSINGGTPDIPQQRGPAQPDARVVPVKSADVHREPGSEGQTIASQGEASVPTEPEKAAVRLEHPPAEDLGDVYERLTLLGTPKYEETLAGASPTQFPRETQETATTSGGHPGAGDSTPTATAEPGVVSNGGPGIVSLEEQPPEAPQPIPTVPTENAQPGNETSGAQRGADVANGDGQVAGGSANGASHGPSTDQSPATQSVDGVLDAIAPEQSPASASEQAKAPSSEPADKAGTTRATPSGPDQQSSGAQSPDTPPPSPDGGGPEPSKDGAKNPGGTSDGGGGMAPIGPEQQPTTPVRPDDEIQKEADKLLSGDKEYQEAQQKLQAGGMTPEDTKALEAKIKGMEDNAREQFVEDVVALTPHAQEEIARLRKEAETSSPDYKKAKEELDGYRKKYGDLNNIPSGTTEGDQAKAAIKAAESIIANIDRAIEQAVVSKYLSDPKNQAEFAPKYEQLKAQRATEAFEEEVEETRKQSRADYIKQQYEAVNKKGKAANPQFREILDRYGYNPDDPNSFDTIYKKLKDEYTSQGDKMDGGHYQDMIALSDFEKKAEAEGSAAVLGKHGEKLTPQQRAQETKHEAEGYADDPSRMRRGFDRIAEWFSGKPVKEAHREYRGLKGRYDAKYGKKLRSHRLNQITFGLLGEKMKPDELKQAQNLAKRMGEAWRNWMGKSTRRWLLIWFFLLGPAILVFGPTVGAAQFLKMAGKAQ